ncbi:TetR/AcrR family transcriptional regulator [Hoyosella rhizosphaerae]|uniref:HTH-type transcriptional regulator n=1 Tax=Hoyosella rhizosphaerae TaxID=1755582 RepID=A0A916XD83_9ACTN|nr:TetR/AcrR family transcriptional regulator [Hoyosella rhizosphaerae]MBN4927727.1 TetR/AcrR family transcriptional regulator [Hoyosella rhizosphaerae]GGC62050.1 putative HTH-type transcriptional regulator [Hoyosella rhizosphaerae]
MTPQLGPPRRTQAERRHATISALLQATIDAIAEVGYSRTTVQEIVTRAGLSQGALFRHFPTRLDVIVGAAEEVGTRQVTTFLDALTKASSDGNIGVATILRIEREIARAPYSAVWDELLVSARTDAELRERITPTFAKYAEALTQAADAIPALAHLQSGQRRALLVITVALFGGEARFRHIHADDELDNDTMELLIDFAKYLKID